MFPDRLSILYAMAYDLSRVFFGGELIFFAGGGENGVSISGKYQINLASLRLAVKNKL